MKDRSRRIKLCEKSLYCFGSKYRWKRLIEKGRFEITRLPDGKTEKRWTPVTLETVENVMDEIIKRREEMLERLKSNTPADTTDSGRNGQSSEHTDR